MKNVEIYMCLFCGFCFVVKFLLDCKLVVYVEVKVWDNFECKFEMV